MMGVVEDRNPQGLNVVDPADRRKVEQGLAKEGGISLLVEGPDKLVFERDCSNEGVERNRPPGRVLGRPKAAGGMRKIRARIDVVDGGLKPPAWPQSAKAGRDGPEQAVETPEEALNDGNVRQVFSRRPFILKWTSPQGVIGDR
jgi:hypothetical protein